jgi:hypothetical protein
MDGQRSTMTMAKQPLLSDMRIRQAIAVSILGVLFCLSASAQDQTIAQRGSGTSSLAVTNPPGSSGQVLTTDGAGHNYWGAGTNLSVSATNVPLSVLTNTLAGNAGTNIFSASAMTYLMGLTNGLGSAAFTSAGAYDAAGTATAATNTLSANALTNKLSAQVATNIFSASAMTYFQGLTNGLGSAAFTATGAYDSAGTATAATNTLSANALTNKLSAQVATNVFSASAMAYFQGLTNGLGSAAFTLSSAYDAAGTATAATNTLSANALTNKLTGQVGTNVFSASTMAYLASLAGSGGGSATNAIGNINGLGTNTTLYNFLLLSGNFTNQNGRATGTNTVTGASWDVGTNADYRFVDAYGTISAFGTNWSLYQQTNGFGYGMTNNNFWTSTGTNISWGQSEVLTNYLAVSNSVYALSFQGTVGVSNLAGVISAVNAWALTGDVTSSPGSAATTIAPGAVTLSKQAPLAGNSVEANNTGSPATPSALSPSQVLDIIGNTRGAILYRGAGGWTLLSPGASGTFLGANGAGADPTYQTPSGGGGASLPAGTNQGDMLVWNVSSNAYLATPIEQYYATGSTTNTSVTNLVSLILLTNQSTRIKGDFLAAGATNSGSWTLSALFRNVGGVISTVQTNMDQTLTNAASSTWNVRYLPSGSTNILVQAIGDPAEPINWSWLGKFEITTNAVVAASTSFILMQSGSHVLMTDNASKIKTQQ